MKIAREALATIKANPVAAMVLAAGLIVLLWFLSVGVGQWWHGHQVNKEDQHLEKQIDTNQKAADNSEANANAARDTRQAAEGRAEKAWEEKQHAAEESNRTLDPVRKARQRYEEIHRQRPADAPALSDDDLCAELAKRNIACR